MKLGKFNIVFEWERNWRYWYMFDTFSTHYYRVQNKNYPNLLHKNPVPL